MKREHMKRRPMKRHSEAWMWLVAGLAAAAISAASCSDDENPAGPPTNTTSSGTGGSGGSGAMGGGGGTVGGGGSGGSVGGAGGGWEQLGSYPGQPPVMPHTPFGCTMNCLDCHETGSGSAPITPHPERLMCRQCHLAQENVSVWVDNNF